MASRFIHRLSSCAISNRSTVLSGTFCRSSSSNSPLKFIESVVYQRPVRLLRLANRGGGKAFSVTPKTKTMVGLRRSVTSFPLPPQLVFARIARLCVHSSNEQTGRRRLLTTSPTHRGMQSKEEEEEKIYVAPFAQPVRALKLFSITSCVFSIACTPVLIFLSTTSSVPFGAKIGIGATVVAAAVGTTSVLNWLFKPYVLRMERKDDKLIVSTLTFFGRVKITHPMSNWINTRTQSAFYVHTNWTEGDEVIRHLMPMLPLDSDEQLKESDGDGTKNKQKTAGTDAAQKKKDDDDLDI